MPEGQPLNDDWLPHPAGIRPPRWPPRRRRKSTPPGDIVVRDTPNESKCRLDETCWEVPTMEYGITESGGHSSPPIEIARQHLAAAIDGCLTGDLPADEIHELVLEIRPETSAPRSVMLSGIHRLTWRDRPNVEKIERLCDWVVGGPVLHWGGQLFKIWWVMVGHGC